MGIRLKHIDHMLVEGFQDGNATTGQKKIWLAPFDGEVLFMVMHLGTAGVTGSQIGDVNINGTTVFTTAGNKPTLTTGTLAEVAVAAIDGVRTFSKGDQIDFSVDAIHSGTAGIDTSFYMVVKQLRKTIIDHAEG